MSKITIPAGQELIFQTSDPNVNYVMKATDDGVEIAKKVRAVVGVVPINDTTTVETVTYTREVSLVENDFSI